MKNNNEERSYRYVNVFGAIIALINAILVLANTIISNNIFVIVIFVYSIIVTLTIIMLCILHIRLRNRKKRDELCIERIRDDLFSGRAAADVIINTFYEKGYREQILLNKISINIDVDFNSTDDAYDIYYDWKIAGVSKKKGVLDEISLLFGGDYPLKDKDLCLKAYLIDEKEEKELSTSIEGASKIKKVKMNLEKFNILENMPFTIRCNYVWKKSFIDGINNIFSFGKNLYFEKTHSPEMSIKINCNKIITNPVILNIRYIDENSGKEEKNTLCLEPKLNEGCSSYQIQLPRDTKERTCFIEFKKE